MAIAALRRAYKSYRVAKADSPLWRHEHLHNRADALAASNDTSRAHELKKMLLVEQQRRQGRAARRLRGKTQKQPVTKVTYQTTDGTTVEACDPASIAAACARSNLSRQHRCLNTPFLQPPLLNALGYLSDTTTADSILRGTYVPPITLDTYTQAFLRELTVPRALLNLGPIDITISTQSHIQAWSRQKDRTASDPSGLSFSHYKSSIHDSMLVETDVLLRQLPLKLGFVPKSWCHITDVEILKKANVYDVDQMRLIQLMDAEFNMNNKFIGKQMMRHAEASGCGF